MVIGQRVFVIWERCQSINLNHLLVAFIGEKKGQILLILFWLNVVQFYSGAQKSHQRCVLVFKNDHLFKYVVT